MAATTFSMRGCAVGCRSPRACAISCASGHCSVYEPQPSVEIEGLEGCVVLGSGQVAAPGARRGGAKPVQSVVRGSGRAADAAGGVDRRLWSAERAEVAPDVGRALIGRRGQEVGGT